MGRGTSVTNTAFVPALPATRMGQAGGDDAVDHRAHQSPPTLAGIAPDTQVLEHSMRLPASSDARVVSGEWRVALRIAVLLLATHHSPLATQAQVNYTTKDKRAIKLYESGGDCMRQRKWACAEEDLKKAADQDPSFIEPRIYLAEMYE